MNITSKKFGTLANGELVDEWTLKGQGGMELAVLTYGGRVSSLKVPDAYGHLDDVVLGYDDLEGYVNDPFFMGVTAGRVAGRIAAGELSFGEHKRQLTLNDAPNHLHGGESGFHTQVWSAEILEDATDVSLALSYISPDGESGYPGEARVTVVYTITSENVFLYETVVEVSEITPITLTHHSYFNLSGKGSVLEHELQINSDSYFLSDERMTLLDELKSVHQTGADFRHFSRVGDQINSIWQKHGDLYWINSESSLKPVAKLFCPASGRTLTVESTHNCLQAYFGGDLDQSVVGKRGVPFESFGALCLECHGYPHAFAERGFGDILVYPNEPQVHRTSYAFS